jgi:hypothetical protein
VSACGGGTPSSVERTEKAIVGGCANVALATDTVLLPARRQVARYNHKREKVGDRVVVGKDEHRPLQARPHARRDLCRRGGGRPRRSAQRASTVARQDAAGYGGDVPSPRGCRRANPPRGPGSTGARGSGSSMRKTLAPKRLQRHLRSTYRPRPPAWVSGPAVRALPHGPVLL